MEKYCQNCRQPNSADALFCRHCASPLAAGGGQNYGQQQNQGWYPPPNQAAGNFAQMAQDKASGRAVASVGLALGGLCCGILTGIPGAILGWMEINAIKEGRASPKGMTMAKIGLWGGIVISVLNTIFGLLYLVIMLLGGGMGY